MCDFRLLGFLTPTDGTDRLSRNVGKELLLTLSRVILKYDILHSD